MMTKQEVFDKVATHLLAQGRTSYIRPGSKMCAYRSDDGGMCAAGKLIDGKNYCRSMEGKRADDPQVMRALLASGVNMWDTAIMGMVLELQAMHDCRPPAQWPEHLAAIAHQRNVLFEGKPVERQSAFRDEWMRVPVQQPLTADFLMLDPSAMTDIKYETKLVKVAGTYRKHQLVPPDVTVKQWIAGLNANTLGLGSEDNPADDFEPDQDDSQPAPPVAHKQGVTA